MFNTYNQSTYFEDTITHMLGIIECLQRRDEARSVSSDSPSALASQAIYTKCGPDGGTANYERHHSAQAHSAASRPSVKLKAKEPKNYGSSAHTGAEEKDISSLPLAEQPSPWPAELPVCKQAGIIPDVPRTPTRTWTTGNSTPRILCMAVNADADAREVDHRALTCTTEGQHCRMRIIEQCQLWVLHQPWPRELPASSQQAGLKKPPPQSSRR
jgi:hypothetical protein